MPEGVSLVSSADDVPDGAYDLIVVGMKPQVIPQALPAYVPKLVEGGVLLSMAAGVSCERLRGIAPGAHVVRVMPNLPVNLGLGVSGLYAPASVPQTHRGLIDDLMAPTGQTLWADSEDRLDRITAVAGSGPGFAFEILRAWSNAAQDLGFSAEEARALVLGTVSGAVALATERDCPPEELRNEVTSKNGTTQAGLEALNGDARLDAVLQRMVRATYARALELR
jgi:pyrroline-5-carboxylate reductase